MQKFCLFLTIVLMLLQASRCASSDEEAEELIVAKRQSASSYPYPYQFNPYSWRPWNFPYYQYQPDARIPQKKEEVAVESDRQQFYPGYQQSCRSHSTGEKGNCVDPTACIESGGRASGTCHDGSVCCINVVTNICHGHHNHHGGRGSETTSINNTYWQSSLRPIKASSSCTLTVKLDNRYPDPFNPTPAPPVYGVSICQVRLDFLVFTISQPDSESICSGDYFEVAGATNTVPNICGFNNGQHMYLHVPPSATTPTDLQLTFNFGSSAIEIRAWNIFISMIPCGSQQKLAPSDCLQYFTSRTGNVKTFNWDDVAGTATRQLANQDYSICFRSTPASLKRQLCLTPCTVLTTQKPFSLSTASAISAANVTGAMTTDVSQLGSLNCNNDFLVIPGGFNVGNPAPVLNMAFDRYCGERLNALPGSPISTTICTTATPFRMLYRTNRDETLTSPTIDSAFNSIPANGNRGFCLSFRVQQ